MNDRLSSMKRPMIVCLNPRPTGFFEVIESDTPLGWIASSEAEQVGTKIRPGLQRLKEAV